MGLKELYDQKLNLLITLGYLLSYSVTLSSLVFSGINVFGRGNFLFQIITVFNCLIEGVVTTEINNRLITVCF